MVLQLTMSLTARALFTYLFGEKRILFSFCLSKSNHLIPTQISPPQSKMSHLLLLLLLLLLLILTAHLIIHIVALLIKSIQLLSALIKLALTIIVLSILIKRLFFFFFFFFQTWIVVADDDIRDPTPEENALVAQDAVNIVRAAFTALARTDPEVTTRTSYSFAVVDGEVVHRDSSTTTGDDGMQDVGGEGECECECEEVGFYGGE